MSTSFHVFLLCGWENIWENWWEKYSGFVPYGGEGDLSEDKLKSCLECLAQVFNSNTKVLTEQHLERKTQSLMVVTQKDLCFLAAWNWDGVQTSPGRSWRGEKIFKPGAATTPPLCRRSGLNPSSPVSGIFFHEPSSVSLICRGMIVPLIFV